MRYLTGNLSQFHLEQKKVERTKQHKYIAKRINTNETYENQFVLMHIIFQNSSSQFQW